jgi:hypothetical protein
MVFYVAAFDGCARVVYFFIYGDEERKFPVVHRLINLSFRMNHLGTHAAVG